MPCVDCFTELHPQEVPSVNAVIEGDEIIFRDFYDISIAVATPKVCVGRRTRGGAGVEEPGLVACFG